MVLPTSWHHKPKALDASTVDGIAKWLIVQTQGLRHQLHKKQLIAQTQGLRLQLHKWYYQPVDNSNLNLSRPGGTLCPWPKPQNIFKSAWSLELLLCDFSFYVFSVQKSSVPPINPNLCCHGNHATFWLNFVNSNFDCFSSLSTWEKLSVG